MKKKKEREGGTFIHFITKVRKSLLRDVLQEVSGIQGQQSLTQFQLLSFRPLSNGMTTSDAVTSKAVSGSILLESLGKCY